MFRLKFALVVASILAITPHNLYAESASTGLTGWGELRTPETVGAGKHEANVGFKYRSIADGVGTRINPSLGYLYGITEDMEAGAKIPFQIQSGANGLATIPLYYKYRFFESELFQFAGAAELGIPATPANNGTRSLSFHGELEGLLDFGPLDLAGSIAYGKADYCAGCEYPGVQRGPIQVNVPVVRAGGGLRYSGESYSAFLEGHALNVANGDKGGRISGDPDAYLLVGGRYGQIANFSFTGYAGVGVVGDDVSNTKAVATLLVHYAVDSLWREAKPATAEEAPAAGPGEPKQPVDVVAACENDAAAQELVSQLKAKNIDARFAGRTPKKLNETSIYITDPAVALGSEIARLLPGKQKMYKQRSLPGDAAVRIQLGCGEEAKPAAPQAPAAAPKKEKGAINIAVINGCGKPGLAEDAARTLLLNGYNVTQLFDEPKQTTPGLSEIRVRSEYNAEAIDIAAKLPGRQRLFVDPSLPQDVDIRVTLGCEQ
jgi:hypothetical protein